MKKQPRREQLLEASARAAQLTEMQASSAWNHFCGAIEQMGEMDIPKFNDLFGAFQRATEFGESRHKYLSGHAAT